MGTRQRLSAHLKQDSDCGDYGRGLEGYSERAALLEDAITAMVEDGWLAFGPEGMSEAQRKCYEAYLEVKYPNGIRAAEGLKDGS